MHSPTSDKPASPTKLYVVHHTHTDIGYTHPQERVEQLHVDFIRQAVDILDSGCVAAGEFRWNCETFWSVERFLAQADQVHIDSFKRHIRDGRIGVSGNYLNFTELIDYDLLCTLLGRAAAFGRGIGAPIRSAMTADVNGYGWGYADALASAGIENLFTCVNTHHGARPFGRAQTAFWWEGPCGGRVLVWSSEHYHFGNELGLTLGEKNPPLIADEFSGTPAWDAELNWRRAAARIPRYIKQLKAGGYPFDFVPVAASGIIVDNAPPNASIAEFAARWNASFGQEVKIEMVTLDTLFDAVRESGQEIPCFRGDWADWWADGVGSTPAVVRHFRDAQRTYCLLKALSRRETGDLAVPPRTDTGATASADEIADNLALYAEHTWGHRDTTSRPWAGEVSDLDLKKCGYAIRAHECASRALNSRLAALGEAAPLPLEQRKDGTIRFSLVNPFGHVMTDIVRLPLNHWELHGARYELIDEASGRIIPSQLDMVSRDPELCASVPLEPGEARRVCLRPTSAARVQPADGSVRATAATDGRAANLVTPHFVVGVEAPSGIRSIVDMADGCDIITAGATPGAFAPVYEFTPIALDPVTDRRGMGLARATERTQRERGVLSRVEVAAAGSVFGRLRLDYDVAGCSAYSVVLTAYRDLPVLDVAVRVEKHNVAAPEGLLAPLPFTAGAGSELWFAKTGCVFRPGIDQLPGTCTDYYLLGEGLAFVSPHKGIAVSLMDSPLVRMGDGGSVSTWLMNNFWETNFRRWLGGVYEFRYRIGVVRDCVSPDAAIAGCRRLNLPVAVVRHGNVGAGNRQ